MWETPRSLVAVVNVQGLPSVGLETLLYVLRKRHIGIAINGDVYKSINTLCNGMLLCVELKLTVVVINLGFARSAEAY